jgi:hypothetical protein
VAPSERRCVGNIEPLPLIRDSVEWIVWAVPPAAKARRSKDGAPGETIDFFLTDRRTFVTVFQNLRQAGSAFHLAGMALASQAKRKGGQTIEKTNNYAKWPISHP